LFTVFPSRIRFFSISDPYLKEFLSSNTKKIVSKLGGNVIRDVHPGFGSRIRILIFYPSRIREVKRYRIPSRILDTAVVILAFVDRKKFSSVSGSALIWLPVIRIRFENLEIRIQKPFYADLILAFCTVRYVL
jgi:hypothetical protein